MSEVNMGDGYGTRPADDARDILVNMIRGESFGAGEAVDRILAHPDVVLRALGGTVVSHGHSPNGDYQLWKVRK